MDLGSFKEGFCLKLGLEDESAWTLCASSKKEKEKWMKEISSRMKVEMEEDDESADLGGGVSSSGSLSSGK